MNFARALRVNQLHAIWSLQEVRLRARRVQKQFEHNQLRHQALSSREARESVARDLADRRAALDSQAMRGEYALLLNWNRRFHSDLQQLLADRTSQSLEHERQETAAHIELQARCSAYLRLLIKRRYLQALQRDRKFPGD